MDIAEKMAADIALAMDGGEWKDGKWYSKFHRDAWVKAVKPYADEIERLRDALSFYASFAKVSPQMNVAAYYIDNGRIAAAALKEGE